MNEAFIWLSGHCIIVSFLMARNFFRIFTENNPVMGYSKTFFIPEAKGLKAAIEITFVSDTNYYHCLSCYIVCRMVMKK